MIRLGAPIREETQMNIRYHVELNEAERSELNSLISGGKHPARMLKRAQILLAVDAGLSDGEIAAAVAGVVRPCTAPSVASSKVTS